MRENKRMNGISLKQILCCSLIFFYSFSVQASDNENKLWIPVNFSGSMTKKVQYLVQPQIRFKDNSHKFYHSLIDLGLGLKGSSGAVLWLGNTGLVIKRNDGTFIKEYRTWQQLTWSIDKKYLEFSNRLRVEERARENASQWSIRVRERVELRIPSPWKVFSYVTFNEIFFNLNHPQWVSPYFFSQNRFLIGVNVPLSKKVSYDIGYLMQFQHDHINRLNHVLQIAIRVR